MNTFSELVILTATNLVHSMNKGGVIMWVLLFLSFLIWFMYTQILSSFKKESKLYTQTMQKIKRCDPETGENVLQLLNARINTEQKLLKSFIAVAPLLGLLGTVGGMIETFSSLQTMELFKPSGGIASGISQALLTTQFGLIVAVPPLLCLKILDKKKQDFFETVKS